MQLPRPSRRGMRAALGATTFCSETDYLILEDEGGRMALRGDKMPVHELVTGERRRSLLAIDPHHPH
jgi:hypothetical protein